MLRLIEKFLPSSPIAVAILSTVLIAIFHTILDSLVSQSRVLEYLLAFIGILLGLTLMFTAYQGALKRRHAHLAEHQDFLSRRTFVSEITPASVYRGSEVRKLAYEIFPEFQQYDELYDGLVAKGGRRAAIVRNARTGRAEGYAVCWPITDTFAQRLIDGGVTEADITYEDILDYDQRPTARFLYVPAVGVTNPRAGHYGAMKSRIAIFTLFEFLLAEFVVDDLFKREILFATYGPASSNLARRISGRRIADGLHAVRTMPISDTTSTLYTISADKSTLERIYVRLMKDSLGINLSQ